MSPAENLATVLAVCAVAGVDSYTRSAAVLTAFSESDFRDDVTQGASIGVYQQVPKYWPSATQGTAAQCKAFLDDFQSKASQHTGRLVPDCWGTQRWLAPDPQHDMEGFLAAPESINYLRRESLIAGIIQSRRLP